MKTLLTIIFTAAALLGAATSSHAATIIVDTLEISFGSDGVCSLREAITNANYRSLVWSDCGPGGAAGTTIQFDPSLAGGTIELSDASLPDIEADLHIQGPAAGPDSLTLDGMGLRRLFLVESAVTLQLRDITLTGGRPTYQGGGAIRATGGAHLILERTRIIGNSTNINNANGGAIELIGSSLSLIDSEVSGNQLFGPSASGGALYASDATVSIERSTIYNNRSDMATAGGIMLRDGSELTAVNSTISGNHSRAGGAGMYVNQSIARLVHTTVAFHTTDLASVNPGIHVLGTSASLVLDNSLVVQGTPQQRTCSGPNIISTGSLSTHAGCTGTATDVEAIGLLLLANNGGWPWTLTHALPPDSVAVDAAGDCTGDHGLTLDQRENPRPGGGSGSCDVGAFEVQPDESVADLAIVKAVSPESADPGDTVWFTLTASNLGPDDARGVVVTDRLPAGYSLVSATADTGSYDAISGQWEIGSLNEDDAASLIIEATVTGTDSYLNIATIRGGQFDPEPANNTDQAEPSIVPRLADLAIVKQVSPLQADIGQAVTFTLTATNLGPDDATNVMALDQLPAGYAFESAATDTGGYAESSGQWAIGTLESGEDAVLTIEAIVAEASMHQYFNSVSISGDETDPETSNNTDTASVTVLPLQDAIFDDRFEAIVR